jgi:hypothetical protein
MLGWEPGTCGISRQTTTTEVEKMPAIAAIVLFIEAHAPQRVSNVSGVNISELMFARHLLSCAQ